MPVILLSVHKTTAQTLENILQERNEFKNIPRIKLGANLADMAINPVSNKVYVTDTSSNIVVVIDSNSGNISKNIPVGISPVAIAVNPVSNMIYVANYRSNTVSVIDGFDDKKEVDIPVGTSPKAIAINPVLNMIYVANSGNNTVSVIDGISNTILKNIPVGILPIAIATKPFSKEFYGIGITFKPSISQAYVANSGNNTVSVINGTTDLKSVPVGLNPTAIAVNPDSNIAYVANSGSNTVSVIKRTINIENTTFSNLQNIPVGIRPVAIAVNPVSNITYVANSGSNTVSVIDGISGKKAVPDIPVGTPPTDIEYNDATAILYVLNSNTFSAIKGSDDKLVAGITFNVSPGNSGNVVCNTYKNPYTYNITYPIYTHLYVESGTRCIALPKKDFEFSGWVQNLGHNSTITLNRTEISDSPWNSFLRVIGMPPDDPSTTFNVTGYGTFTTNFKPLPPPVPAEYWASLFTIVATALIGSLLIPAGIGWFNSKRQTSRLNSYHRKIIDGKGNIKKLNELYDKITNAYTEGKINNEQCTNLKTEIAVYYEEIYEKRINSSNVNLLDKVKDEIKDAYAKEKISEKHYNLLIERISDRENKLSSNPASTSVQGRPIKSY